MNNNLKVVLGTVAGIMIGGLTIAGANQAIQAIQNTEIKVSLNGQIQEFKDETTGEVQYPITYHDRTYLPIRNVASLYDLEVDYDDKTNTAILKRKEYPVGPNLNRKYEDKGFSTGDYLSVSKDEFNVKINHDVHTRISAVVEPRGSYVTEYPKGYYNGNYYKYEWKVEDDNIISIYGVDVDYSIYEPNIVFDAKKVGTTNIILTVTTADEKETVTKNIVVNVTE